MRKPNSETSPSDFYKELEDTVERYKAKIEEHKNDSHLTEYYTGRLDAAMYIKRMFSIMFYEPKDSNLHPVMQDELKPFMP